MCQTHVRKQKRTPLLQSVKLEHTLSVRKRAVILATSIVGKHSVRPLKLASTIGEPNTVRVVLVEMAEAIERAAAACDTTGIMLARALPAVTEKRSERV